MVVQPALHDVQHSHCSAGTERGVWWALGGAEGAARGRGGRRSPLRSGTGHRRNRSGSEAVRAGSSGNGRHRRDGMRARLHCARQHSGEMVSRSPRHGHGHGHHGIRRRRVPGWIFERVFHEPVRRRQNHHRSGRRLLRHHDDRRASHPPAAGRLAAGRLGSASEPQQDDHQPPLHAERSAIRRCSSTCCGPFCSST